MLRLYEESAVAGKKHKDESYNNNWKSEIEAYDSECQRTEKEFYDKHIIISQAGNTELTEEESDVLNLYLNGISCDEIAKQYKVELEVITGLMEIIQAKLSLIDK